MDVAETKQTEGFSTSFTVDRSPREVFDAINDVRCWWTGESTGGASAVGEEFTYRHQELDGESVSTMTLFVAPALVLAFGLPPAWPEPGGPLTPDSISFPPARRSS